MNEPTIDQAIEFIRIQVDNFTNPWAESVAALAIKALEEMKEKDKDCCPHVGRCKDNYKDIPAKCDQESRYRCPLRFPLPDKPRTWRDVTAGEMSDLQAPGNIIDRNKITYWAGIVLQRERTKTDHWRSMGA